jgi:predicted RNA-binding protein with PUA-like domain
VPLLKISGCDVSPFDYFPEIRGKEKSMRYWLVKTEPEEFSWEDHAREGVSMWNGVRNYAARNHLRAMALGDQVLIYYSGKARGIIGLSEVARSHYPDPTAAEGDWSVVDLRPLRRLQQAVSLDVIKTTPALSQMALLRLSRLSVQPVTTEEFDMLMQLAGELRHG